MRFYVFSTYGVAFVYFWWGVLEGGGGVLSILSMFSYLIVLFFIF